MSLSKMAENEKLEQDLSDKTFKCCVKKIVKNVICVNCGNMFHKSCVERKNLITIDETRIICCENNVNTNEPESQNNEEIIKRLVIENTLLKQIIQEKEEKYTILLQNKYLLDEKLTLLSKRPEKNNNRQEQKAHETSETKTHRMVEEIKKNTGATPKVYSQAVKKQQEKTTTVELENEQLRVMQKYITLDNQNSTLMNENDSLDKKQISSSNLKGDWEIQTSRKNRRARVGQAENENNKFKGIKPKVWLYLHRVEMETEDTDIKQYLVDKTGESTEEFVVKELDKKGRYKEFMVAGDFKYKQHFYNPQFWPKGVRFRRFDFDIQRQKSTQKEPRTDSFLNTANFPGGPPINSRE